MLRMDNPTDTDALVSRIGSPGLQAIVNGGLPALAAVGHAAVKAGFPTLSIGVFSPVKAHALALRDDIAQEFPMFDEPDELFEDGCTGRPLDAMLFHSPFEGIACHADIERVAAEFTAIIARVGGFSVIADRKFLSHRQHEIERGLLLDIDCRARGEPLPRIAWLHEVAELYRTYKERFRLIDIPDLCKAATWSDKSIRLLLLDGVSEAEGLRLKLIFPNAAIISSN